MCLKFNVLQNRPDGVSDKIKGINSECISECKNCNILYLQSDSGYCISFEAGSEVDSRSRSQVKKATK